MYSTDEYPPYFVRITVSKTHSSKDKLTRMPRVTPHLLATRRVHAAVKEVRAREDIHAHQRIALLHELCTGRSFAANTLSKRATLGNATNASRNDLITRRSLGNLNRGAGLGLGTTTGHATKTLADLGTTALLKRVCPLALARRFGRAATTCTTAPNLTPTALGTTFHLFTLEHSKRNHASKSFFRAWVGACPGGPIIETRKFFFDWDAHKTICTYHSYNVVSEM